MSNDYELVLLYTSHTSQEILGIKGKSSTPLGDCEHHDASSIVIAWYTRTRTIIISSVKIQIKCKTVLRFDFQHETKMIN